MLSNEDYQHIFHEIKNTVALIRSSLQLIQKQHPEVSSFHYWEDTLSDVNSLKEIITELSTAKLCEDNLHLLQTDVAMFLDEVRVATRASFEGPISCQFITENDLPPISMDSFRMKQALVNLMKNAYESMSEAGNVLVHTYASEDHLVFDVIDSGCGIQLEDLERIFTPLYTSKSNGSGLGLSITKAIIDAHGGQLSCCSTPGSGSTFSIALPYKSIKTETTDLTCEGS